MIADRDNFPGLHYVKNGMKLFMAVHEANGDDWVIDNIFLKSNSGRAYFGENNILLLACNHQCSTHKEEIEFLSGIKKGLDIMAEKGDTLFIKNWHWNINVNKFNYDSLYRKEILYEYDTHIETNYKDLHEYTKIFFGETSSCQYNTNCLRIDYEPLFSYLKVSYPVVEATNRVFKDYVDGCTSKNLNILGATRFTSDDYTIDDYMFFIKYLLLTCDEVIKAEDEYAFDFVMLPITYDGDTKLIGSDI